MEYILACGRQRTCTSAVCIAQRKMTASDKSWRGPNTPGPHVFQSWRGRVPRFRWVVAPMVKYQFARVVESGRPLVGVGGCCTVEQRPISIRRNETIAGVGDRQAQFTSRQLN